MPFVGDSIFPRHDRKRRSEEARTSPGTTGAEKQASHLDDPSQPQRKLAPTKRARTATSSSSQDRVSKSAADTTTSSSSAASGGGSTPRWGSTSMVNPVLLLPCHICYRRPLKTTHLDRFTSCQHCGKRACQICIRSCRGENAAHAVRDDVSMRSPPPPESEILMDVDLIRDDGDAQERMRKKSCSPMQVEGLERTVNMHREVICSRCCVEMGADGEVVCYGCLSGMEH